MTTDQQRKNLDHGRNKKGRPKGSRNRKKIVQKIAAIRLPFKVNGRVRKLPVADILVRLLLTHVEKGKPQAIGLYEVLESKLQPHVENENTGFLVVPGVMDKDEWIKLAEERNATAVKPNAVAELVGKYSTS